MNDFCIKCVGGDKREVYKCNDRYCPFWLFRRANLEWQERRKEYENSSRIHKMVTRRKSKD